MRITGICIQCRRLYYCSINALNPRRTICKIILLEIECKYWNKSQNNNNNTSAIVANPRQRMMPVIPRSFMPCSTFIVGSQLRHFPHGINSVSRPISLPRTNTCWYIGDRSEESELTVTWASFFSLSLLILQQLYYKCNVLNTLVYCTPGIHRSKVWLYTQSWLNVLQSYR